MLFSLEQRRLLLAGFALAAAATVFIPLPGTGPILQAMTSAPAGGLVPEKLRLFALFLNPYVDATSLLLLASGLVPVLRAEREGDAAQRRSFDRMLVVGAVVISGVMAAAYSIYIANAGAASGVRHLQPMWVLAVTLVAAEALLLFAALWLTRWGVGNGVAVALAAGGCLPAVVRGVITERSAVSIIVVVGLAIAYTRVLRATDVWPLEPNGEADGSAASDAGPPAADRPGLRMRHNLLGLGPVGIATAVMSLPFAVMSLLPPTRLGSIASALTPSSLPYGLAWSVIAIAACGVLLAIQYDPGAAAALIGRHGYRVQGVGDGALRAWLTRQLGRRLLVASGLSVALGMGPLWLIHLLHIKAAFAHCLGLPLFVGTAVVLDTLRHDRALRAMVPAPSEVGADGAETPDADEAEPDAWVVWGQVDTELEAELMCDRLARAGIESHVACNRAIALLGTFGPWEWCPPRYPSLTIHRRLGGGTVTLCVRAGDAERVDGVLSPPALEAGTAPSG